MEIDDLETPVVLIDREIAQRNILGFQAYCLEHGLQLRPHIKTHKIAEFAQFQVSSGAVGINCQKLGEAEVMVANGLDDILITYNILGEAKLARLLSLSQKLARLAVTADSDFTVQGLSSAFAKATRPLDVLVECDTGMGRCGVQSPDEAVALARLITQLPGLAFAGLMTYPAKGDTLAVQTFMAQAVTLLATAGLECQTVTSGGSPDMWQAHRAPIVTEYRVGTYIYNDRSLVAGNSCSWEDCALSVLTTVVSVPAPGRAIIDAGSKALTSDLMGQVGHGYIIDHPDVQIVGLSEEHGHLAYPRRATRLEVGQRLRVIPNHACVVSNLVDEVVFVRGAVIEKTVAVSARGRIC
jgi:D-serine deaminase-like pyridoxal phosphate-dependent protein